MSVDDTVITDPTTPTSRRLSRSGAAAGAAAGLASGFAVVVAVQHILKSDLDPTWRMVSEYEIGEHGWLMRLAFVGLGAACAAMFVALGGRVHGKAAGIGRAALLVATVGTVLAGIFPSDPITATKAELTTSGNLHALGTMLGVPGLLLALTLLTRPLTRSSTPSPARAALRIATAGAWISIGAFMVTMALTYDGAFSSDVPIGVPNRLLIASFVVWIVAAARLAPRPSPLESR